jgi:hypothetical protein
VLNRQPSIVNRTVSRVTALSGALAVSSLVLTGCSVFGSAKDTVVYSAWVDGGSIAEGQYYLIDGGNGAMSYPIDAAKADADAAHIDPASWSIEVDGGSAPRVEIAATEGGIAHCVISSPETGVVLAHEEGASGQVARCESR